MYDYYGLITAINVFNLEYEFNTVKSFPGDLPSRVGFEIVEEKFNKGDLAQTTVLVSGTIDTFLVRGMLLPSLILLFEKDKKNKKLVEEAS